MYSSNISIRISKNKIPDFLAIDFENANYYRISVCSVGLASVGNLQVVSKESPLSQPSSKWFVFSDLQGITWNNVKDKPTFKELLPSMKKYFRGKDFIAAHNAPFDKRALFKSCEYNSLSPVNTQLIYKMQLSRNYWGYEYYSLNNVCEQLQMPFKHPDPLSDALTFAKTIIKTPKKYISENKNKTYCP